MQAVLSLLNLLVPGAKVQTMKVGGNSQMSLKLGFKLRNETLNAS